MSKSSVHSPANLKKLRVALVHDYLREYGGAERVVEALHQMFPEAPLYTAFVDPAAMGQQWQKFADWDIRTTWLARVPGITRLYSPLRILAPRAFAALDLSHFDLVLSSSNAYFAKAVRVSAPAQHVCYCHTPSRALYGYTTLSDWRSKWWLRIPGEVMNHYLRIVDFEVAQKVGHFVANSRETQRRIRKFYRRESTVIFPPIYVPEKRPMQKRGDYWLYVNRLALAKHPELAVQACSELGWPLKVVGSGPLLPELQTLAGPTVELLGGVSDEHLRQLYSQAKGLIYPVEDEDFGMVPVEAMAYGLPVVAHRSGGPLETIVEGKTGLFFDTLDVKSLKKALQQADKQRWSAEKISTHAHQFSQEVFTEKLLKFINSIVTK